MADKSLVASAYAEVRADVSKLPADLAKVPSIMKRMVSVEGLKAVRDILTGNVTGGLVSIATRGYELQAQKMRELAKGALEAKKNLEMLAGIEEQRAGDKKLSSSERSKAGEKAQLLREGAARKQAMAEGFEGHAQGFDKLGKSLGGKVAIAAQMGMMALKVVLAAAVAYIGTLVLAAHRASENLKTAQLVRATGEAAGWTAQKLQHMGEELRKNSKFSESAISGAQAELLKRPNIKGDQFKKALDTAANLASVMGTDLPQAASELGDILADPLKAADGALEKYGVLLNGAQQGQIKNAVAARDWAKAQELVLGYLKRFEGAAKEAGETGSGGFEKLKNSVLAAAAQIGGANGDIGKMAARMADAIDKFMELQIVKDIIDLVTLKWLGLSEAIESFVTGNASDIQHWADQVSEIYHNVRDNILAIWEEIKNFIREASAEILGYFGTDWGEIKALVTAVLDEISLLTTNFGLTAKYVWVGIQLAAQDCWDMIRDGLAAMVVAFEAAWKSVGKGAEAAWSQIESVFTGGSSKSIAEEMAKAWRDGLSEGVKKYNFGESEAAKKLKGDLADIRKQMVDAREGVRARRAEEAQRKEDAKKNLEKAGKGTDYVNTKPFKFEFVGFEELARKIQTSLYPTEAIQLQRAGVNAAQQAVNNGNEANKKLDAINGNLGRGLGFGP